MISIKVGIDNIGIDAGPFNLYSDVDNFITAFETNITKIDMSQGYISNNAPENSTTIRVKSIGLCNNFLDIPITTEITSIDITTTTTAAPTTTTTTTAPTTTTTTTTTSQNIYNVTNNGASEYIFNSSNLNQAPNPPLTLLRGETYTFNVNSPGHPFFIKTTKTTGDTDQYNDGIANNGTENGTITFVVPNNAPNTLYYNCKFHASMNGEISIP